VESIREKTRSVREQNRLIVALVRKRPALLGTRWLRMCIGMMVVTASFGFLAYGLYAGWR